MYNIYSSHTFIIFLPDDDDDDDDDECDTETCRYN